MVRFYFSQNILSFYGDPAVYHTTLKLANGICPSCIPKSSSVTSIYAGSVLAVGMCGCQSLEGLVRYFESVTTHFNRGQPIRERHQWK